MDQQRSVVLSVICSVVEKHSRQVCFLTFSSKLVETRSKPYFGGTVLKFALERISIKAIA